ncbi:hypothetical protein CI15_31930 [Paraburkholderia monticola]|uniref:Uncharacterized protein n=1 Tax=Paraburkholderia monticola TaxID=1399968 RepID=A0A149PAX8_9BURK|nr:hypothetical protein CI15_31930 [Paraburkholderia monticola]
MLHIFSRGGINYLRDGARVPSRQNISQLASGAGVSGMVIALNAFATVVLAVVIDPQVSVMTDDVIEGRISENSFRRAITTLAGARVLGTLCAQIMLVPAALIIVRVAELI